VLHDMLGINLGKMPKFVRPYLDALEAGGRYGLMVWPVHCEIGTWGHNVQSAVREAYGRWEVATLRPVRKVFKGMNAWQRLQILSAAAGRNRLPVLYVNQVGGQDQLVYDGGSFGVEASGRVTWEAPRFESACATLDFEEGRFLIGGGPPPPVPSQGLPPLEFYRRQIVLGIRDYARRCGFRRAVVGCSGGIDSALTLTLAVEALGARNVAAITMPSRFSSTGSVQDSELLCRNLGIELIRHPIQAPVAAFERCFQESVGQRPRSLRSRARYRPRRWTS
jgi:hypothetical protein